MKNQELFTPYVPTRAFDEVADRIKSVILTRRLKPGERLPSERRLAEQFNVGRLTIREALRTLESKGLISIKKGSGGGSFVGSKSWGAVASIIKDSFILEGLTSEQITEARIALECATIESAIIHCDDEDLERINSHVSGLEKNVGQGRLDPEFVSKMLRFHLLIAEASHNPAFLMFMRAIFEWALSRPLLKTWTPPEDVRKRAVRSFRNIHQAIREKDIRLAQTLIREYIDYIGMAIQARNPKCSSLVCQQ